MTTTSTNLSVEMPVPTASIAAASVIVRRGVLVGLVVAYAMYGWIWSGSEPATFDRYLRRLATAQLKGGPRYAAMVGDSITAAANLPLVCGKPVVKAAFNGARVADLVDQVVPTLRENQPSAVLLAAGVNDSWRHIPTPRPQRLAEFRATYRALIVAAQALTPHVGIILIPPVAAHGELGAAFFDTALISDYNAIIEDLAAAAQAPTFTLASLAGADGLTRVGLTQDGVHLSSAGYAIWTAAVGQAWTRIKVCG